MSELEPEAHCWSARMDSQLSASQHAATFVCSKLNVQLNEREPGLRTHSGGEGDEDKTYAHTQEERLDSIRPAVRSTTWTEFLEMPSGS